jgi:hypothetical protein
LEHAFLHEPVLFFKKVPVAAITRFFKLVGGDESQRRRIDAVAQSRGLGAVIRTDVPDGSRPCLLRTSVRTMKSSCPFFDHVVRLQRAGEAGPPGSRIELVRGAEQGLAGHHIHIDARFVVVPVFIVERRFGAVFTATRYCSGVSVCLSCSSLGISYRHPFFPSSIRLVKTSLSPFSSPHRPRSSPGTGPGRNRIGTSYSEVNSFCSSPGDSLRRHKSAQGKDVGHDRPVETAGCGQGLF